jgi:hypothetical protein
MTNAIFEELSDHTAPPGHVTFSVLDLQSSGHSVSIASKDYPRMVRTTKHGLSNIDSTIVFKEARAIIRRSVGCIGGDHCRCNSDGLHYAFIAELLKHPDKRTRKKLMTGIDSLLRKEGGAHVMLFMPPTGPSAWALAAPVHKDHVQ